MSLGDVPRADLFLNSKQFHLSRSVAWIDPCLVVGEIDFRLFKEATYEVF